MSSDRPETLATRLAALLRVVLGAVLGLFLLMAAVVLPNIVGLPPQFRFWSFLAMVVVLLAVYGLRTQPLSAFGVRSTVGYAVAREGRCDECGGAVTAGERRRYARQVVAFGRPAPNARMGREHLLWRLSKRGERIHRPISTTRARGDLTGREFSGMGSLNPS